MSICPNCKGSKFEVVWVGCYVACVTPGCHWTQTPSAETMIDAAIYTWHGKNPPVVTQADMERVDYVIALDHNDEWRIWRVGFSGRSVADPRTWAKRDRWLAQAALAEFARAAESQGMVA